MRNTRRNNDVDMRYAICPLSVVPVRSEPSDTAEITTEVLFGEFFKVLERRASWSRIRLAHDGYEGWVSNKQYAEIDKQQYDDLCADKKEVFCAQSVGVCKKEDGTSLPILIGSRLPMYADGCFSIAGEKYSFDGYVACGKTPKSDIAKVARGFLNAPYLWGGRSFFGIDCSGLVQLCYRLCGRKLPRDAKDQAQGGEVLSFIEEAEEGDLAFFDNEEGVIVHVGIVLADHMIIHASGQVRVDRLDQTGIYNSQINKYTHKLRLLKRM